MRLRHLPVLLFLLLFVHLSRAQSAFRAADSLSVASRYLASNEVLENLLRNSEQRLHDQSRALFLMSYNYLQLGNFKQAQEANDRSKELRDQLMSGDIAENYMRTGAIALQQGNYEKALEHLFAATSMPIEEPRLYALIYGYIASAFEGLGQPEKALNYYRQSLETLESATEGSQADVATNYYNIGRIYLRQNQLEAAKRSFRQALNITGGIAGRKDIQANLFNALGETMRQDTPSVATRYYHQALHLYRSAYGQHHREIGRTLLNLGQLHFDLNEPDSARIYANGAITVLCPGTSFEKNLLAAEALTVLDRTLLAWALHLQSALALQQGNPDEAAEYGPPVVKLLIDETLALGDEASKLRLLSNTTDIFEVFVEAAYQIYQKDKSNQQAISQAFYMTEVSKALLLRMTLGNLMAYSLLPDEMARREASLRATWRDAESAVILHHEDPLLFQKAREARLAYQQFLVQIIRDYPAFEKAHHAWPSLNSVADLQKTLAKDDVLLSYFIGKTDYYIFALTEKGIFCKKITKSRDFKAEDSKAQKLVKRMMQFQEKPVGTAPGTYSKFDYSKLATDLDGALKGFLQSIKKSDLQHFPHYAQLLYDRLILPVDSVLKGKTRLLIIPHKGLFAIPFEALISNFIPTDDDTPMGYHKLNYLVKSYTIQYHYAAVLATPDNTRRAANGFLGMAPVFDNNASQSYIWDSNLFAFDTTYQGSYSMRAVTADGLTFQALPESEREAVNISRLFAKKKKPALAYLRMEASERKFKENANGHDMVHLATHSFVNYANPALSGIAFSQPNIGKPDTEDGILYATEIAGLNLSGVHLVTLSSCESGSGPDLGNEGALSLTRSFLSAGVPNVLSSLWKVYDNYTAQLMPLFYEQALDDKGYAQALRQAKLKMVKDSKSADPRKWSGFVLFGAL